MESPNGVIANCDNLPQSALETRILTKVTLFLEIANYYPLCLSARMINFGLADGRQIRPVMKSGVR